MSLLFNLCGICLRAFPFMLAFFYLPELFDLPRHSLASMLNLELQSYASFYDAQKPELMQFLGFCLGKADLLVSALISLNLLDFFELPFVRMAAPLYLHWQEFVILSVNGMLLGRTLRWCEENRYRYSKLGLIVLRYLTVKVFVSVFFFLSYETFFSSVQVIPVVYALFSVVTGLKITYRFRGSG